MELILVGKLENYNHNHYHFYIRLNIHNIQMTNWNQTHFGHEPKQIYELFFFPYCSNKTQL